MKPPSSRIRHWLSIVAFGSAAAMPVLAQAGPRTADGSIGQHGVVAPAPSKPSLARPDLYGTAHAGFIRIDASEMAPDASINTFSCINNCQLRYLTNVSGLGLTAPIHLPSGALITYAEIDYYDGSATGEVQAALGVCDYAGESCTFYGGDGTGCSDAPLTLCSGNAATHGYSFTGTDMTGDNLVVDNLFNRYIFSVGNTTNDGSTAVSQIIVGYVEQVSPPPGVATFNDVPTDHPFFQYIEALNASGITGGCGSGNYCPDAPLTRGQMAVFLSKALGLFWSH